MNNYDSGSPSPPPADGHTHPDLQHASISDLLLHLRRTANDRPADGHSRHRQQQEQMDVIKTNLGHAGTTSMSILCVYKPDDTTSKSLILVCKSNHPKPAFSGCHHRATSAATPYRRNDDHQVATTVVCLAKMLSADDRLRDDGFYQGIQEDITKEARKFGDPVKVVIPRPGPGAAQVVAGVGKVFLEYAHLDDAVWCRRRFDGRRFRGRTIAATFFSEDRFASGNYGYDG